MPPLTVWATPTVNTSPLASVTTSVRVLRVAGLGVLTLVGCEVLAATAAYEPSDSPWAVTVGSSYGLAMLLIGVKSLIE